MRLNVSNRGLIERSYAAARAREANESGPRTLWPEYRGRELDWIRDVLGRKNRSGTRIGYHAGQRAMVESHFGNRRTFVRGPRKCSKTFTLVDCILAAANTRPCVCLVISSSWTNVKRQIFGGIRKARDRSPTTLPGRFLETSIEYGPGHYVQGISTKQPENAQGYHADTPVPEDPDADITDEEALALVAEAIAVGQTSELHIFLDEAPGIDSRIYESLEGAMQGPLVYVWVSCNPTLDSNADHFAARLGLPGAGFHRIAFSHDLSVPDPITADERFSAPNWVCDPKWVRNMRAQHGEDSPWYRAMVLGQYAGTNEENRIVTASMLAAAAKRTPRVAWGPHVGIDLSGGGDYCVAALWVDGEKRDEVAWRPNRADPAFHMATAQRIVQVSQDWGRQLQETGEWDQDHIPGGRMHADKGGLGDPILSRLSQMGWHLDRVDFGGAPRSDWSRNIGAQTQLIGPDMDFGCARDRMHWVYRRAFEEGLAILPEAFKDSWQQAQWPTYELAHVGGRTVVKVIPKPKIKREYGRSPDNLDADLLAWCRAPVATIAFG